jgi:hypothetical protein
VLRPAAGGGAPRPVGTVTEAGRTLLGWVLHAAPVAVALAAMTVVLLAAGELARAAPAGIPDAGAAVDWSVAAGRLLMQVCAVLTVGCLLVPVLLDRDAPPGDGHRPARTAAAWALAWAVCSACLAVLTLWHVTAVPPGRIPVATLPTAVWALLPARALLLVALLAAGAALLALAADRTRHDTPPRWDRVALGVAVVALAPPLYTGHAGGTPAHELATGSLLVHVVAASLWVGGLAALVLWTRPAALPAGAARFSTLALGCYAALVVSGLATAAAHLGTASSAWWSGYGAVLAAKTLAVVALGLAGYRHRVRTLPRLAAGRPGPLLRLATVELLIMGAAMGMATALSRTPGGRPADAAAHGGAPAGTAVPGLDVLQDWQPEPVLSTVVLLGLGVLAHRSGLLRPGRGGLLLVAGAGLAVLALGLPDDAAGTPLLGFAVARHLVLTLVLPALVLAALHHGSPPPLPHTPYRSRVTPTTAFAALVASTVLVVRVPATWSTGPAPGHLLLPAASLLCGAVVVAALVSRTGAHSPAEDDPAALTVTGPPRGALVASALFLGSVAALVLTGAPALVPAGPADARLAGGLLAGAAVALLLGAAAGSRGHRGGRPAEHDDDASARDFALS